MNLATVLSPLSAENLRMAAQCSVTDLVTRYPGPDINEFAKTVKHARNHGLRVSVIEGYLPIERLKLGKDEDGKDLEAMKMLIRHMGELDVPVLCYNWMAGSDWIRTRTDVEERGGALVSAFNLAEVEKASTLNFSGGETFEDKIDATSLWRNLERFLEELIPVAEKEGVYLAMHPDDPPLPELLGKARIMKCVEDFERLVQLAPSPHNAICYCQGNFAAMGVDIPESIRRLGSHIRYVHFRDVRGTADNFVETFHDNGPTDMPAAMRAYREVGFDGPIRPDHVPQFDGEEDGEPGYTMLGRLYAFGYIRGLIQATQP